MIRFDEHDIGQIATKLRVLNASNHHIRKCRGKEQEFQYKQEELYSAQVYLSGRLSVAVLY